MTGFELQIVALILFAFVVGVAAGYMLRTRVFPPVSSASDGSGITLESRQQRPSHSLLRRGASKSRKTGQESSKAKASTGAAKKPAPASDKPQSEPAQSPASARDNLQEIKGIGAVLEKKLNALGIERFEQIAEWSESDIEKIDETLNFRGRVQRERWVEQARELARRSSDSK